MGNEIKNWNNINWIGHGYKEGDTFSIYGNEYAIDSNVMENVDAKKAEKEYLNFSTY